MIIRWIVIVLEGKEGRSKEFYEMFFGLINLLVFLLI